MKTALSIITISILSASILSGCGTTNKDTADTEDSEQESSIEITPIDEQISKTPQTPAYTIPTKNEEEETEEQKDTDGDGIPDSVEELIGTDPLSADTDKDGVIDSKDIEPTDPTIKSKDDYPTADETLEMYLQALKDRDIDKILSFQNADAENKKRLRKLLEKVFSEENISSFVPFEHRFEQEPIMGRDDDSWKEYGYTIHVGNERLADTITIFRGGGGKWVLSGL